MARAKGVNFLHSKTKHWKRAELEPYAAIANSPGTRDEQARRAGMQATKWGTMITLLIKRGMVERRQ